MKRLIYIFIFTCFLSTSFAQSNKDAKLLLDKVTTEMYKDSGVEIKFEASTFVNNVLEGSTLGKVSMKGDQFILSTQEAKTWYNGKYQWSLIFEMDEVNISEPTEEELREINPYQILKSYKKNYIYKLGSLKGDSQEVILTSRDQNQDYQTIKIWISKTLNQPKMLEVIQRNKKKNILEIKEYRKGLKLNDRTFEFHQEEYPNVEIIDLR